MKAPHYTTFRRYVRRYGLEASPELPFELVQSELRQRLNDRKHTVIETTWKDETGEDGYFRPLRIVSVRYVTGGMRHGLGPSIEYPNGAPHVIEFQSGKR